MMIENLEDRRLMSVSIGSIDFSVRTADEGTLGGGVLGIIVQQVVKAINDAAAQAARRQ